ncbi:MAG: nitrite reductase small subunit NirD [Spirochaetia bacterium]|nr:nitrite reductase small subunit NirD [Spirochaetia bacterium]
MTLSPTENVFHVAAETSFPQDAGVSALVGEHQIAIFRFSNGEWYACDNACPHTGDMVLARGLTGDQKGEPKVACPQHKRSFSLKDGRCLSGESYQVKTYPVEVKDGQVYLKLPPDFV